MNQNLLLCTASANFTKSLMNGFFPPQQRCSMGMARGRHCPGYPSRPLATWSLRAVSGWEGWWRSTGPPHRDVSHMQEMPVWSKALLLSFLATWSLWAAEKGSGKAQGYLMPEFPACGKCQHEARPWRCPSWPFSPSGLCRAEGPRVAQGKWGGLASHSARPPTTLCGPLGAEPAKGSGGLVRQAPLSLLRLAQSPHLENA